MKTSIVITKTGKRNLLFPATRSNNFKTERFLESVNEVHSRTFHQSSKTYDRDTMRFIEMFGSNKTKGDKDYYDSGVKVSVEIRHWEDQIQMPFEAKLSL